MVWMMVLLLVREFVARFGGLEMAINYLLSFHKERILGEDGRYLFRPFRSHRGCLTARPSFTDA